VTTQRPRPETVLVMDFGAQYVQLIVRKVREQHVYSEIRPATMSFEQVEAERPAGIILSGGPNSVYAPGAPTMDRRILEAGIPVLGICYGQQLMAHVLGGEVGRDEQEREYGHVPIDILDPGMLFAGIASPTSTWMSHGDKVMGVPPGFKVLARSLNSPVAAMADPERKLYGVQFHPEVGHTQAGTQILRNFLHNVCGCSGSWEPAAFIDQAVTELREKIGEDSILCGVSGGVDSMVTAALLDRAVGDRLTCMFIDHGLMRKDEAREVIEFFSDWAGEARFVPIDASETFISKLAGVTDPEQKRRIIGETFIRTFEAESSATFAISPMGRCTPM